MEDPDLKARDLLGAPSDWDWGRPGCCCGHGGSQVSHFSDGTLFAILAAGALAFYVLYSTIMAMGMGMEGAMGADGGRANQFRVKREPSSGYPYNVNNGTFCSSWSQLFTQL